MDGSRLAFLGFGFGFSGSRIFILGFFILCTLYLIPGVTNTKWARLTLISGFPPPLCYSVYKNPVNCETGVKPLENEYDKALQMARAQNKPILIDFTGWACVNCRRMEENVWVNEEVKSLMKNDFRRSQECPTAPVSGECYPWKGFELGSFEWFFE